MKVQCEIESKIKIKTFTTCTCYAIFKYYLII